MKSTLSLMGMYNFDETLFDNLKIPENILKEDVIYNLLMECAEFEVVYTDFTFLKNAIGFWSSKQLNMWKKLYNTTQLEYNPIWNKDGTVTYTDKEIRALAGTAKETRNLESENTETRDLRSTAIGSNVGGYTDTSKDFAFGFNSETAAQKGQAENNGVNNNTTTGNGTDSGTVSRDLTDKGTIDHSSTDSGTVTHEYSRLEQGNIGVTTTQSMIREEREIVKFNIIDYIINDFKTRFCILVY